MEHFLIISRGKTLEKNFRGTKLGPWLGFLLFYQGCIISFDIAQDCSFGQFQTSSRAVTSKNLFYSNWGRNDLFSSNVVECPLKLACFFYDSESIVQIYITQL